MKVLLQTVLGTLLLFSTATAQERPDPNMPQGVNFEVPEGWEVRLDHNMEEVIIGSKPDSSDIYFVNMTPGWHITTGPAGIFYHPANTASGNFSIELEIHFFDPGERNREGYGIFWGGSSLQDETQEYAYFLLRNTGEFLIKTRAGEETETVQGWTESDAIIKYENPEESSVLNKLMVKVAGEQVLFFINEEEVASVASSALDNDGVFGLRVNHSVNLHISDLRLTP
jgi:hypothetical protein